MVKEKEKYYKAVGRRKTSTCVVRLQEKKKGEFLINERKLSEYFPSFDLQETVMEPLSFLDYKDKFFVSVKVRGGGVRSQAEAIRHGISRALVNFDDNLKKRLKSTRFLTRDPRMRERKKPGLRRARRSPQWRKR